MSKVVVVGGGAAGMFAAIFAAKNGNDVFLYEKNEKLGKKLFITGKGRCNVTNACDIDNLFSSIVSNKRFLYSAFHTFNNIDTIDFFESLGLKTKVERGDRVFPLSDHSSDVIKVLAEEMKRLGVTVFLNKPVKSVIQTEGKATGIVLGGKEIITCDAVIVATGGVSYESTGSTGDGYRFAKEMGHSLVKSLPSLVPIETKEDFVKELQGLSLKNVTVTVKDGKKELFHEFGEMLFTHYGLSGPLILTASSILGSKLNDKELKLSLDLKPALSEEQLDKRLLREFDENIKKQFKNAVTSLFPAKMIPVMIELSGISPDKKVNEITKEERTGFVHLIKNLEITLVRLRGFQDAIITKGGINVKEINPSTMESKKVDNLYFIGEVLDLDAVTGGFNLQIAWSTAYLAGTTIY